MSQRSGRLDMQQLLMGLPMILAEILPNRRGKVVYATVPGWLMISFAVFWALGNPVLLSPLKQL